MADEGGGAFEVLRGRLKAGAASLRDKAQALNARRLEAFGGGELALLAQERLRTEQSCLPRDMMAIGPRLLVGYRVHLGLRSETRVSDVLGLHALEAGEEGFRFEAASEADPDNFLAEPAFVKDFKELFHYYRAARLLRFRCTDGQLLAAFQTGTALDDVKAFRWAIERDGRLRYLDNRGERDHVLAPSHDFEWIATTRAQHVAGRHPHVSVLDEAFVDTVGGDLTIKVENNTEDGLGIHREPVREPLQSLDDAQIHYGRLGVLILLRVLPYKEEQPRYFVFNTRRRSVHRLDAIGQACLALPEDHGIVFPGGYYLQTGQLKTFDGDFADMEFLRRVRSPNGEDVLFAFHEREEGRSILLPYNTLRRELANPISGQGYGLFEDGRLVVFRVGSEPTRVHPVQVWQTPFTNDEHAAARPAATGFLARIGNPDLVRGISDALSLARLAQDPDGSAAAYEDLIAAAARMTDAYHWLGREEALDLAGDVKGLGAAGELALAELEKVDALRQEAERAVAASEMELDALLRRQRSSGFTTARAHIDALHELRCFHGRLGALRQGPRVEALEALSAQETAALGARAVAFLLQPHALLPFREETDALLARIPALERVSAAGPLAEELGGLASGLDLLIETLDAIEVEDAPQRTQILEQVAERLGAINRARALLESRRRELLEGERRAEFGALFTLLGQSAMGALAVLATPEACDEGLARLTLQLESLEGRFGEIEDCLAQITTKREDVQEAFASRRQALVDARQHRASRLREAGHRLLEGITRRAGEAESLEALQAYFHTDGRIERVRRIAADLRGLGGVVQADELESSLQAAHEQAGRALRDRLDLYESASVIRLGRHRFSVSRRELELTLVPRGEGLAFHLVGTDYHGPVQDPELLAARALWDQLFVSETPDVSRAEFLAHSILADALAGREGLSLPGLVRAAMDDELARLVQDRAAQRYEEGYERGVHDHDAALVLRALIDVIPTADLLRFPPRARAAAALFWARCEDESAKALLERRATSLLRLRSTLASGAAASAFADELGARIGAFLRGHEVMVDPADLPAAGRYLCEELGRQPGPFVVSGEALGLLAGLDEGTAPALREDLRALQGDLARGLSLATAWLEGALARMGEERRRELGPALPEAAAWLLTEERLPRKAAPAALSTTVGGLLAPHPRVDHGRMALRVDEFLDRLSRFTQERAPAFRRWQLSRHAALERERERLRLAELRPRVMASFVRSRLIDEVYLPLIGDDLAKQIGSLGEDRRSDRLGLLLLVSPPGYGKTTLMEWVAERLGLVFVKVSGPAIGSRVTSLDPAEAPSATARQEVERINLAFELGNNALLYLDDVQHLSPELLQRFIPLCDAQRRIEGVWQGRPRTYDLRGKRFCVCMAGNPYTESGQRFRIPDMLANRADAFDLGNVLAGRHELFALSYIENALTSNPALAPLAARGSAEVARLVHEARSGEPADDVARLLRHLLRVQETLLRVNREYIRSASQEEAFRGEPRFQLQGSYRNMNRLAEKVVAVMNDDEIEALIDEHYRAEAQSLTTGAEHNLLKLAELRGRLSEDQRRRWEEIKRTFARRQLQGGPEEDPGVRLVSQLAVLSERVQEVGAAIRETPASIRETPAAPASPPPLDLEPYLVKLNEAVRAMAEARATERVQTLSPGVHELLARMVDNVSHSLLPLVQALGRRLKSSEMGVHPRVADLLNRSVKELDLLKELVEALRRIDARAAGAPSC